MKDFLRNIQSDRTMTHCYLINGFSIITILIFILFFYGRLPPFLPVFNQLPWGEQRLGPTITIFVPVVAALLILIINIFTSAVAYNKVPLVSRMLAAISLLAGVLVCLFIVKTVMLIL